MKRVVKDDLARGMLLVPATGAVATLPAMAPPEPVLLFDVFSLMYRAFFALPPMSTVAGEPTSALYGFSALILKMLREERPRGAAFALDWPGDSLRRKAFAG